MLAMRALCSLPMVLLAAAPLGTIGEAGPALLACAERPTVRQEPWFDTERGWCVELPYDQPDNGLVGITALASAPGGWLVAARPYHADVVRLVDTDGDALPDAHTVLAGGFMLPSALLWHDGALLVAGGGQVHEVDAASGATTLLAEVPWGETGAWAMALAADDAGTLYIGVGGDGCVTEGRGAVWQVSLAAASAPPTLFAVGLGAPSALLWRGGALWATDAARDRLVRLGAGADAGACSGTTSGAVTVLHTFAAGSAPYSLAAYPADGPLTPIGGDVLVALHGSTPDAATIVGYALLALPGDSPAAEPLRVLPNIRPRERDNQSWHKLNIQGSGFWPLPLYAVAVDVDAGWVYIATGAGRVYALRPA